MTSEKIDRLRTTPHPRVETEAQESPPNSASDARAAEHWRSVLGGMGPREVLARLLQGDPLELRRVVAARLQQRAYLFDADRVQLRALAHCARYGVRYRGTPPLEVWLAEIVDQALLDLLREDLQAERRGSRPDAQELAAFVDLARPLGLEPAAMRRVCLAHNLLREEDRRAFHGLVIAGRALEQVAAELAISGVEVARRARRGLETVLIAAGQSPRAPSAGAEAELEHDVAPIATPESGAGAMQLPGSAEAASAQEEPQA